MSRRLRNRLDKRDTALELARLCGHGDEKPGEVDAGDEPIEERIHTAPLAHNNPATTKGNP